MRASDFIFATKLANTMDWNMAPEDFEFMTNLEPEGCFVAFQGRERAGIATSISFSRVGWFGNLIVKEKHRKQGAGSLLVKHAVNYLRSKGAQTIGLYAYPDLVRFYSNFGFTRDEDFLVLHTEALSSLTSEKPASAGAQNIQEIEEFDSRCFGGNRKKLLESIILDRGNLCYYASEGGRVTGYVAATVYEKMAWVGPLICSEGEVNVALSLVRAVLGKLAGKSVYAVVPKKEDALANMLFSAGLSEDFYVTRMFLGQAVAKNCIYMAESLERG
jgi:GNAT superfamily N-acetyltransferase